MARHTYATAEDLTDYPVELDDDANVPKLLADASARVDELLEAAVYPVDDAGMPTEPEHIEALKLATCAVVQWMDDIGDDGSGAALRIQSASIAGLSLGIRQPPPGGKPDRYGDAARRHLRQVGLRGGGGPGY